MTAFAPSYGRILISRPAEQGRHFAALVCARAGGPAMDAFIFLPLMDLEAEDFTPPDVSELNGLIFSSSNGVRFFAEATGTAFTSLPLYVVGSGTADLARTLGFHNIEFIARNADDLCRFFSGFSAPSQQRNQLLFVRGADVHTDFASALDPARYTVQTSVVYRAHAVERTPAEVASILAGQKIGAVTFFSQRTVRLFLKQAQDSPQLFNLKNAEALCISKDVLEAVRPVWEGPLYVAPSPDQDGMADLVISRLREQSCT